MNLKNVIRRSTAGISALCLAASYLSAGSFNAVNAATVTLYGDFNCDGVVDLNDVIELSKYLKDPESVPATEQGLKNADVYFPGRELSFEDVQAIIESLAGKNTLWTNGINNGEPTVHYGDADCDGDVDFDDVDAVYKYLQNSEENPLTHQGSKNADVYYPGRELTYEDAQAITEYLAGFQTLWTNGINYDAPAVHYGDADYDGDVDFDDVTTLLKYLGDKEANPITPQGLKNADSYFPGRELTYEDAQVIVENLAGFQNLWTNNINNGAPAVHYGDVDYDGDVDFDDVNTLLKYLGDSEANPITPQGLKNADSYFPGRELTYEDAQVIVENLAGFRKLWTNDIDNSAPAVHYGDVDYDGDVDFDDVNTLLKYLGDSEANPITPQGLKNADSYYPGRELTYADAQVIVENLAGFRNLWTNDIDNSGPTVHYGDADCDGDVDFDDVDALNNYLKDKDANPLTPQGLKNADSYYPGRELTYADVQVIIENLAGIRQLWTNDIASVTFDAANEDTDITGDFNCDGAVTVADAALLNYYLQGVTEYQPSEQALKNANAFKPDSTELDLNDVAAIVEFVGEKITLPAEELTTKDSEHLAGDFNCDNAVNIADLSMLFKYVTGTSDYQPSKQGLENANVFKKDSPEIDTYDVQALAEYFSGKTTEIPTENLVTTEAEHLAGDFNCDNAVNIADLSMLFKYLNKTSDYQPSEQGIENANIYKKDSTDLDMDDLQALAEYFSEKTTEIPTENLVTTEAEHLAGDFNCDNTVNIVDLSMLFKYLNKVSDYQPSEQGLRNANIYKKDSTDLDMDDLQALAEYFAGKNTEILTDTLDTTEAEHLAGDFNCDNAVNIGDLAMLFRYIYGVSDYQPSKQGLENANVYRKDSTDLDAEDLRALAEFFREKNTLPTEKLAPSEYVPVTGDFNCDNTLDIRDVVMYYKHLEGLTEYVPSEQGKKNANNTGSDKNLNYDDLLIMTNMLSGKYKEETDLSKCSGDVNEDGEVNAEDIVYLRKVLLGSAEYKDSCDVNHDDSFSTRDFVILKALILQPAEGSETEPGTETEPEPGTEPETEPETESEE